MFVIEPELLIGQQLGNYRLLEFLKGGGFGLVYRAEHVKIQKIVVVKLLRPELVLLNKESIATFEREAKVIASFAHPHIIDVSDYGDFHGIPYIVMPFIEQGSLRTLHPRGSIVDPATILSYVKQIASALQYGHDRKFVHRDVKPDNFLLGSQGMLLSDFGLATTAHSINSLSTQDGSGTPFYMASEQYEQKAQVWSDQYSLAVVVYEWLCGKLPFEGESYIELYQKHQKETPPSFKQQDVNVPPAVERVVMKGLAKDPQQRYATVTEFANQLEQAFLDSQALPKARPPSQPPSPPLQKPPQHNAAVAKPVPPKHSLALRNFPQPRALLLITLALLLISSIGFIGNTVSTYNAHVQSTATAVAAAKAYDTFVATNGMMFGFDAAHTYFNPMKKCLIPQRNR